MSYPGNKHNLIFQSKILSIIPPHKRYIELFLGSGGILNKKKPVKIQIGIEVNPAVIDKFIYVRGSQILNVDVFQFLKENITKFKKTDFIYADPPYLVKRKIYNHTLTEEQHRDLALMLNSISCKIAVSHYECELYDQLYIGWNKKTFNVMTRGGKKTECIYFNYTPEKLHDYKRAGENFTDRQRIKRKIDRFIVKMQKLNGIERNAIIRALIVKFNYAGRKS